MFEIPARSIRIAKKALEAVHQDADDHSLKVETEWYGVNLRRLIVVSKPASDKIHEAVALCLRQTKESFDQGIYAAHRAINKPMKRAGFPWAWSAENLNQQFKTLGVDARFHEAIRAFRPYGKPSMDENGALCRALNDIANDGHSIGINAEPILKGFGFDKIVAMGAFSSGRWVDDGRKAVIAEGTFGGPGNITLASVLRFDHERPELRLPVIQSLAQFIASASVINAELFTLSSDH